MLTLKVHAHALFDQFYAFYKSCDIKVGFLK